jgi:hypothetical protein
MQDPMEDIKPMQKPVDGTHAFGIVEIQNPLEVNVHGKIWMPRQQVMASCHVSKLLSQ